MSVIIFIAILFVLVLVHEFGHFIVAKLSRMRVDEFGFGYPPRALKLFHYKGTDFTLNWLPFGGFVKIFGENGADGVVDTNSFSNRPWYLQSCVLLAGVVMNFILAWAIVSAGLMYGLPTSVPSVSEPGVKNISLIVSDVLKNSPAEHAGIKPGDTIVGAEVSWKKLDIVDSEHVRNFVRAVGDNEITMTVRHGGVERAVLMTPVKGITPDGGAIGVSMELVGFKRLPFFRAVYEGLGTAWYQLREVTRTLGHLVLNLVRGHADISQISGPVGIVGIVGTAYHIGLMYLMTLTAMISLNLVVINLLPFPALDGGRLLMVIIEAVTRRKISPKVTTWINTIGFGLLILLMLIVTWHDVVKLIR